MWNKKTNSLSDDSPSFSPEPVRPVVNIPPLEPSRPKVATPDQGTIGRGIVVKGEVTGSDPVFVDGRVEGAIHIPGERVTVGKNGTVVGKTGSGTACITAREIVILGTVTGDIVAAERVDIRAAGSLTGNVTTVRVSIEDGAFFRGAIDIRREDARTVPTAGRIEEGQPV